MSTTPFLPSLRSAVLSIRRLPRIIPSLPTPSASPIASASASFSSSSRLRVEGAEAASNASGSSSSSELPPFSQPQSSPAGSAAAGSSSTSRATFQIPSISSIGSGRSTAAAAKNIGPEGFLSQESYERFDKWMEGEWGVLDEEVRTNSALSDLLPTPTSTKPFDLLTLLTLLARSPSTSNSTHRAFTSLTNILNGTFFLEGLADAAKPRRTGWEGRIQQMERLGVWGHLEEGLVGRARGMSGNGFLWLVRMNKKNNSPQPIHTQYSVLSTYSSGTLLVRGRQIIGRSSTTLYRPSTSTPNSNSLSNPSSSTSSSSSSAGNTDGLIRDQNPYPPNERPPGSDHETIVPLACVYLNPEIYGPKYGLEGESENEMGAGGIRRGREEYVREWMRGLNWGELLEEGGRRK